NSAVATMSQPWAAGLSASFRLRITQSSSKPRRALHLVVPVEAHVFDDAVTHHDDAAFLARLGEVLMHRERRHIDVIAPRPFEFLRLVGPFPFEGVEAVPFQIPMQVVAGAFDHEEKLLPHMTVLAGAFAIIE